MNFLITYLFILVITFWVIWGGKYCKKGNKNMSL